MTEKYLPTICVDFDGVIHSYSSGWKGVDKIPDPPVPGAIKWLVEAVWSGKATIAIYSSRSKEPEGVMAIKEWLMGPISAYYIVEGGRDVEVSAAQTLSQIQFPTQKPAAIMTIDDRAHCFMGGFRSVDWYLNFKPWNKRSPEENIPAYDRHGVKDIDEERSSEMLECLQDCLTTDKDGFITFEPSALGYLACFMRDVREDAEMGWKPYQSFRYVVAKALRDCPGRCLDDEEDLNAVVQTVMREIFDRIQRERATHESGATEAKETECTT
jgi:hypothetical protein